MTEKKDSARVRVTKRLLRDAFTGLLMEKPLASITVRELCQRAQLNRGTFYMHYTDIYELMDTIEAEMVADLQAVLEGLDVAPDNARSLVEPCRRIFEYLRQNSDMCIILLGHNSNFVFVNRLVDMGKAYCLRKYMECYPTASEKQAEYFYSFVSSGCIGLLRQWASNDFRDPTSAIAQMAENLLLGAAKALTMPME